MSKRSLVGESSARAARYALVQLRINAAFAACQILKAAHSLYAVTPGGKVNPTQPAALLQARTVCGLFTVTWPFSSRMVAPPSDTCHSNALQVNASEGAPCQTKPQKSLLPFARSPS